MHKIMAQEEIMNFFSDNERVPPRHAGGNGNQGINFVWPYAVLLLISLTILYSKTNQ